MRSAQGLLKLCEKNGGAYIKVGQHLGALDYLLPHEYVQTMKVLHSHAPQTEYDDILRVIKHDLKCEVQLNISCLSAASIYLICISCISAFNSVQKD